MTHSHELPHIRKADRVDGRNLILRDVTEDDAEFILSLRLDSSKNQHLSPVENDVKAQREWINKYREGSGQAYFIICTSDMNRIGTVRLYDASGHSFSWGSWVLANGASPTAAVESAILVYWFGTRTLGFRAAHFQVNRANAGVISFHQKFGARITHDTELEVFMTIDSSAIEQALLRYERYVPNENS